MQTEIRVEALALVTWRIEGGQVAIDKVEIAGCAIDREALARQAPLLLAQGATVH